MKEYICRVKVIEGISKKTGKPYRFTKLEIDTEEYGTVDLDLDTRNTRAGFILDVLARKEN